MIDRPVVGGFGGSIRSMMSDGLQRRLAEQEAAEAREAAQEERERALRAEAFRESNLQAAIAAALEAGEEFHPRMLRGERLGHTTSEFIAARSAQMDVEDAQLAARQRVAYNRFLAAQGELNSGDMSAPTPEQQASRAVSEERHREASINSAVRNYERRKAVKEARQLALHDTLGIVASAERHR
jgi:hypothetical protein